MPPLLLQKECLRNEIERPSLPILASETSILRQRFDTGFTPSTLQGTAHGVVRKPDRFTNGLVEKLHTLAWRASEMDCPIQIGAAERRRRKAAREAGKSGMQRTIGDICERRDAIGIAVLPFQYARLIERRWCGECPTFRLNQFRSLTGQ